MTLDDLLNNMKKKVGDYFAPTQNIRTRDIVREVPNAVGQTFHSLQQGNLGQDISKGLEQFQFFKPTEQVRARDFVRELPTGIDKSIQGLAQGIARFGISAVEAPKTLFTQQASNKFYNTPFGRINSFQSEAQNRVQRGDPLWKAIGNPALDTILAGADIGALVNPILNSAKTIAKTGPITSEIANLADDFTKPLGRTMKMTIPSRLEGISPNIYDNQPGMGTFKIINGKLRKVDGFQMTRDTKPFQMPAMEVDVPFQFNSKTLNVRPGMNIQAVDDNLDPIKLLGKPEDFLRLPDAGVPANTPSQAKKIFAKGQKPRLEFNKKPGTNPIVLTEDSKLLNPELMKQEVQGGLQNKFDNFEKGLYGSAMSDLKGGTKGATRFQQKVRPITNKFNQKIEKGLSSDNGMIRNVSRGIRSLFGQAGSTSERIAAKGQMKGGVDTSRNLANDFQKLGDDMLPDSLSREKVWAHLDPELSGVKVGTEHLSPEELKAVDTLREASDLINDQNYAMNKISHETWIKGRGGKYITRAYEDYDLPPELSEAFQKGSAKLDLGGYKQRGEVTDWKQENAIKDPFYLAAKRIQSTFTNKALSDYGSWIAKQADTISDAPKDGYTQLSDSPTWGELSGKFVRHDVLTDMKGFYSDNKALQGLYDALNAYDRFKPRQILKKTKTVYNPATRLGNQISNRVFAIFNGVNPVAFEKNMQTFAKSELANNGQYARVLRDNGILGTDMTKYELVKNLAGEGEKVGKLGKIDNAVASSYGAADDRAKVSAFKYWLDKGKTTEEAITKVRKGFQDYSAVGQLYDVGSKLPLVGKPFIRFQSELGRIIKNSILENPTRVPMVVGSIALMGAFASKVSGESPEDKLTRENRFGTPVVPFTNIPLVMQTPYGEVNIARMFGMYETAGADTTNKNIVQRISKYSPIDIPTNKEDALKMVSNDPFTGGITSLITDTDFRGKSIADPEQSKYKASNLTPGEQNINRLKYLGYNYNMPVVNDLLGVKDAIKGEPNQYQQVKTPKQAVSKLVGIKVEDFGPKQAQETRVKDQQFAQYKKDDIKKNINSIMKDYQTGKIDEPTMNARIQNQQKNLAPQSQPIGNPSKLIGQTAQASEISKRVIDNPSGGFSYTDSNGDFKTAKSRILAERAVAKIDLLSSDKSSMKVDGGYLRKNETGDDATFMSDNKYDSTLYSAQLTNHKKNKNVEGWITVANKQFDVLQKQLEDPNTDEVDKIEIQNKIDTLVADYQKFKGYGGFTKGKKGKAPEKIKISFSKVDVPKPIKFSSTVSKISTPKLQQISSKRIPKVKIKKINLKRSISTLPGAKRLA